MWKWPSWTESDYWEAMCGWIPSMLFDTTMPLPTETAGYCKTGSVCTSYDWRRLQLYVRGSRQMTIWSDVFGSFWESLNCFDWGGLRPEFIYWVRMHFKWLTFLDCSRFSWKRMVQENEAHLDRIRNDQLLQVPSEEQLNRSHNRHIWG